MINDVKRSKIYKPNDEPTKPDTIQLLQNQLKVVTLLIEPPNFETKTFTIQSTSRTSRKGFISVHFRGNRGSRWSLRAKIMSSQESIVLVETAVRFYLFNNSSDGPRMEVQLKRETTMCQLQLNVPEFKH